MTKQEILDYLNQYRNAGNHIHREAMDAAIEAFEIADRLERADAKSEGYPFVVTECVHNCRESDIWINGYRHALADIRGDNND